MLTSEEKIREIELHIQTIRAVNDVLLDCIARADFSGDGDYLILLELQNEHLIKISELF